MITKNNLKRFCCRSINVLITEANWCTRNFLFKRCTNLGAYSLFVTAAFDKHLWFEIWVILLLDLRCLNTIGIVKLKPNQYGWVISTRFNRIFIFFVTRVGSQTCFLHTKDLCVHLLTQMKKKTLLCIFIL